MTPTVDREVAYLEARCRNCVACAMTERGMDYDRLVSGLTVSGGKRAITVMAIRPRALVEIITVDLAPYVREGGRVPEIRSDAAFTRFIGSKIDAEIERGNEVFAQWSTT